MIAPRMPVEITSTAVSAGSPPNCSEIAMATPAVTDFGASEISVPRGAPSQLAIRIAEPQATTEPTTSAAIIGASARATMPRFS